MKAFAARWLTGDERTLGLAMGVGMVLTPFFRIDWWRDTLGVPPTPEIALGLVIVLTAIAWRSLLRRAFVWLEPYVLTWQDFGALDREAVLGDRLLAGWLGRLLAVGYLAALLGALAAAPAALVAASVAVVLASGVLALGLARLATVSPLAELAGVFGLAALGVWLGLTPWALYAVAAVLLAVAVPPLVRSGSPRRPLIAVRSGRAELVAGWRERVVRTVGVSFLDVGMLLPAARPPRRLRVPSLAGRSVLALTWVGVLGRVRYLPAAALFALLAVAAWRAFPALPEFAVVAAFGYLAVVPFGAGLGELWRSAGLRRWVGRSDTVLRAVNLAVLGGFAACWVLPVVAIAALGGAAVPVAVLLAVPVIAASVVRTATRPPPSYEHPMDAETPFGRIPIGLVVQAVRGPDLGTFAVWLVTVLPLVLSVGVVAGVVLYCVLR